MKKFLFVLFTAVLALTAAVSFAQDTTADTPETGNWFSTHLTTVFAIVVGVYEVAVRYIPTVKNISILSYAMKFIQFIIPNQKKGPGEHE